METITPSFILTLIMVVASIGVQFGIYQSFKIRTELELQKFEERMSTLEKKAQETDLKLQKVLDKIDNFEKLAMTNWQRIFTKLDQYDENIKIFYRDYELKKRISE